MAKKQIPPVQTVIETAAAKVDTSSWQRMGVLIGSVMLTVFGGHIWTNANVNDRVTTQQAHIDTTLAKHWQRERASKDSASAARDTRDSLANVERDSAMNAKLDYIILKKK